MNFIDIFKKLFSLTKNLKKNLSKKPKEFWYLVVINLILYSTPIGLLFTLVWWFIATEKIKQKTKRSIYFGIGSLFLIVTSAFGYGYTKDPSPTLTITTPTENLVVQTANLMIEGSYSPENFAVYVNDKKIEASNGVINYQLALSVGANDIELRVSNYKTISKKLTVVRELSAEELARIEAEKALLNQQNSENNQGDSDQAETEKFFVSRVIDGDTIELSTGEKVRYIGIDTPETVDPNRPTGCYGKEASNKNKELVEGKEVELEKDVSETDKYGRLLRYVYVDGVLVNDYLVRQGYAHASSYPPDVKYQEQFRAAEREAQENKRGLWSDDCVLPLPTTAPTLRPRVIPTTRPTAIPIYNNDSNTTTVEPSATTINNSGSCKYSCSGPDRDCADFSTQAEAQQFFSCCGFTVNHDPMRLDGVGVDDGIACESLP